MDNLPPRYAFRLEDLRTWHVVRVSCRMCRHKADIAPTALKQGRPGYTRLVDLEGRLRCRNCGRGAGRRFWWSSGRGIDVEYGGVLAVACRTEPGSGTIFFIAAALKRRCRSFLESLSLSQGRAAFLPGLARRRTAFDETTVIVAFVGLSAGLIAHRPPPALDVLQIHNTARRCPASGHGPCRIKAPVARDLALAIIDQGFKEEGGG